MGTLSVHSVSLPRPGLVPLTGYKSHHHDKVEARIHFILTPDPHTYKKVFKSLQPWLAAILPQHHTIPSLQKGVGQSYRRILSGVLTGDMLCRI
jgi:hypothetical protein